MLLRLNSKSRSSNFFADRQFAVQGDFYHWVALINRFDAWFEAHVKPRYELNLVFEEPESPPEKDLQVDTVVAILRVTSAILENCSNKHLYHSYEVGT